MPKAAASIASYFHTPDRFMRSVQLERDFRDVAALDHYVLTPSMADAFARIADGLRTGSGRRAWRVTGDYGVGKSSFALVLAHLLADRQTGAASRIASALGWEEQQAMPRLWPILLTGTRGSMIATLARGIREACLQRRPARGRMPGALQTLIDQADEVEQSADAIELEALIEAVREQAAAEGRGVLLVVDELGKLLEHAANRPDREDIFILQRLAELASRSGERPMLLVGILHQGFHAYAERLPASLRHEWDKVAGRFDEIVFDQPLAHTAALVSGALGLNPNRLPDKVRSTARGIAQATAGTGWLGGGATGAATLDAARLYPLHPTLLPVAVRFFARFGQHERSLFGFLLSSEPFAVQSFAQRTADPQDWYGLADFYDYVRTMFGHRLAGQSYRSHWLRIVATVDAAAGLSVLGQRLLKTVAILNLLDADDLLPTVQSVEACLAPAGRAQIDSAIAELKDRGLLFQRGGGSVLRLWPQSSVSLDGAMALAARHVSMIESVSGALAPYLERQPMLARRHYLEEGTLRYFELRYAPVADIASVTLKPTDADGVVLIALADGPHEVEQGMAAALAPSLADRPDILIGVTQPLLSLAPDVQDLRCWQWVADNTPELAEDAYAAAEVARQLASARRALGDQLADRTGVRSSGADQIQWFRAGSVMTAPERGGLAALLSDVCDRLYGEAPRITNELLNRNVLSSAASAARMRLIEGLFAHADRPFVGIDPDKAPPEKSMYLSVIRKGGIHVPDGDSFRVREPDADDPLRLKPALDHMAGKIITAAGGRVPVQILLDCVRERPWGVRAGVAPLLLAIILLNRSHELAVYEDGTFLHRFGSSDFMRLIRAPKGFEIQHCSIAGVRMDVFRELARAYAAPSGDRQIELLDIVRTLCLFAAQLPDYSRATRRLSSHAVHVRDALLGSREPVTLLFQALPVACGVEPFSPDETADADRVQAFVTRLHDAIDELRAAYPELVARIIVHVTEAMGDAPGHFDRAALASRAAQVALAAREPRLRAFANRLRDPQLSDEAWVESLASFVVARPPHKWGPGEEARFSETVGELASLFYKVEATAFGEGETAPSLDAIRLNLTRGDGQDLLTIVQPTAGDDIQSEAEQWRRRLPQDSRLRLHLLSQLLWEELEAGNGSKARTDVSAKTARPRSGRKV
ncbi:MAG: hypothetical protein QM688_01120 [Sphingomonas bacterium]